MEPLVIGREFHAFYVYMQQINVEICGVFIQNLQALYFRIIDRKERKNMHVSTVLKWISGGLEALLGVPILGGTLVIALAWTPLAVMFILHVVTLVFSIREGEKKHGSILGIVTSCVSWIPFVGMTMHIITAIILMIDAYNAQKAA